MPIAEKLKSENITIITFGIQSGNYAELYNISSSPNHKHSFLLDGFSQFESLARKALHSGTFIHKNRKAAVSFLSFDVFVFLFRRLSRRNERTN